MINTKYYRLMLGKGSRHAEQCLAERFVGADYGIERDLSRELPDSYVHTEYPDVSSRPRVIVVGEGPGGLFASLRLIELG